MGTAAQPSDANAANLALCTGRPRLQGVDQTAATPNRPNTCFWGCWLLNSQPSGVAHSGWHQHTCAQRAVGAGLEFGPKQRAAKVTFGPTQGCKPCERPSSAQSRRRSGSTPTPSRSRSQGRRLPSPTSRRGGPAGWHLPHRAQQVPGRRLPRPAPGSRSLQLILSHPWPVALLLLLLVLLGGTAADPFSAFLQCFLSGLREVPLPASCAPFGSGSSRTPPASPCPLSRSGSTGALPTTSCPPFGSGSTGAPQDTPAKKAKKRAPAKPRVRTHRPPSHSGRYRHGSRKGSWDRATFSAGQEKVLEPVEDDLQWENHRCAALDGAEEEAAAALNQLRLVRGLIQQLHQLGLVGRSSAIHLLSSLMPAAPLPP